MKPTIASAPGRPKSPRLAQALAVLFAALLVAGMGLRVLADCSSGGLPFTDLGAESTFCAAIAEAYFTGLTNGTSATTYGPSTAVTRDQMAAFITRTLDQSVLRNSRRGALDRWWTQNPQYGVFGLTNVGSTPKFLKSDGTDVWVSNEGGGSVTRVRASDGKSLATFSVGTSPEGLLVAMNRVFVARSDTPGKLAAIDPVGGGFGDFATVGDSPLGIAFDGGRIWTANSGGSVSIVSPASTAPWTVMTVTAGFDAPEGIIFDGTNMWVTDFAAGTILRLDAGAAVAQTVTVGTEPKFPAFDGHNLWVPNSGDDSLTVVRVSDGAVLKTFSAANGDANGLSSPVQAAFDGQRILVSNGGGGVSLFRATDLTPIGNFALGGSPSGVCSDGEGFWVTFPTGASVGRF